MRFEGVVGIPSALSGGDPGGDHDREFRGRWCWTRFATTRSVDAVTVIDGWFHSRLRIVPRPIGVTPGQQPRLTPQIVLGVVRGLGRA